MPLTSITFNKTVLLQFAKVPNRLQTSSLTANSPVLSASPPGTRRDIKIPGNFSSPLLVTFTDVPSLKLSKNGRFLILVLFSL